MVFDSGTRFGPYEILNPIGFGGMGEVYRARDTRLDRLVAVKVIRSETATPQALERFEREARTIASLYHPGICAIYDVGTTPSPFLVMELLDGETLHQRLLRGRLEVPTLVDVGLALAEAIAAAHARGVIHRDLKPANIILTAHGPKIVDFGLARITEAVFPLDVDATAKPTLAAEPPLTDTGFAVGTAAYMSPEQLRGDKLDARTDLFSLGLVLYEMATGQRAFSGATAAVISAAILHEQPVAPRRLRPDLTLRIEQTILTLLEKDREIRTQTASELRAELLRLKRELSVARGPDAPGGSVTEPVSTAAAVPPPSSSDAQLLAGVIHRHRGAVAGVALVALMAVVGIAYLLTSRPTAPPTTQAGGLSIAALDVEQLTTSGTAAVPVISPDGNNVVYIERGPGGDSLRVRRSATGSNNEILPPEPGTALHGGTITPDDEFVNYVKQVGSQPPELWQVPILGGGAAPRRLLQGGRVAFSPNGSQMAYVRAAGKGRTELVVVSNEGTGEKVLAWRQGPESYFLLSGPGQSIAPAWSPDGATIAVLGGRNSEPPTGQIVFVDVKSGKEETADKGPIVIGSGVAWLTGDTLLVSMLERGSEPLQLWLLSFRDRVFSRLTNETSQLVGVSLSATRDELVTQRVEFLFGVWTSDGGATTEWVQTVPPRPVKALAGFGVRWIGEDLVYLSGASYRLALSRWQASTKSEQILAEGAGFPSVTRDRSTIRFWEYDSYEGWKMDLTTLNRVRIQPPAGIQPQTISGANLTPDGRHYVMLDTSDGVSAVVLVTLDGSNSSRTITTDRIRRRQSLTEPAENVEVSPDGQWIAYPSREGKQNVIAVCDLATCSSRRTFSAPVLRWRWMPDSKALAYVDANTQSDLWIQPLDGSAPRPLTHFTPDGNQIWDFDWDADGRRLAVARGKTSTDIVLYRGLNASK
jgi:YD repeat-containing protein